MTDGIGVSIHASSREDATRDYTLVPGDFVFQSTRPRGRTRRFQRLDIGSQRVSIHASSREDATSDQGIDLGVVGVSIHASSREDATIGHWIDILTRAVSIHASSREDATNQGQRGVLRDSFNPRVLAGGRDKGKDCMRHKCAVSIHASSREDATIINTSFKVK